MPICINIKAYGLKHTKLTLYIIAAIKHMLVNTIIMNNRIHIKLLSIVIVTITAIYNSCVAQAENKHTWTMDEHSNPFPKNGVLAGFDSGNMPLYVGRTTYSGNLIPGTVSKISH